MRFATLACFVLLSAPALAQTGAEALVLPRIIDSICLDLIPDRNGCETAVLLTSETDPDSADLIIFSDRRTDPQEMLLVVRNVAYNGPWFGQSPFLEGEVGGPLLLREEQIGIGRSPWEQTLTIVHRDDGFLVAGQTYGTYDRISPGSFSCDVNLLTGDWTTDAFRENPETAEVYYDVSQTGQLEPARPSLADWSYARGLPTPCAEAASAWFYADQQ
jgi:hypothetical protein